jgi:hypothetical protein
MQGSGSGETGRESVESIGRGCRGYSEPWSVSLGRPFSYRSQVIKHPTGVDRLFIYNDFMTTWPDSLTEREKEEFIFNLSNYDRI